MQALALLSGVSSHTKILDKDGRLGAQEVFEKLNGGSLRHLKAEGNPSVCQFGHASEVILVTHVYIITRNPTGRSYDQFANHPNKPTGTHTHQNAYRLSLYSCNAGCPR